MEKNGIDAVGAFMPYLQGGSFLLLVSIAVWLMRWVPKRFDKWDRREAAELASREKVAEEHRKEVEELAEAYAKSLKDLSDTHTVLMRGAIQTFAEQTKYEREACAAQFQQTLAILGEQRVYLERSNSTAEASYTLLKDHNADAKVTQRHVLEMSRRGKEREHRENVERQKRGEDGS